MSRLTLRDKITDCHGRGEILPLKGHFRIELEDVRDGSKVVEEVDNMATAAISSIINHNYSGLANISSLLPLRSLFGGVCLFQNAQTENANNYNPPSDNVNPLIAHAGDVAPAQGYTGTLRGSPVPNDYEITDTSIKQVWMWDNTQGNGHIESVSLVPAVLGNMGLKPADATLNPLSTFGNDVSYNNQWSEAISKEYPMSISDDGKTSRSVWIDGTTFKEYQIRHDYNAFGIMRDSRDWQDIANRTATIRTGDNRFVFDDADYYYIARATSATSLQIDKVNKETFVVSQADCSFSGVALWTGAVNPYKNGNFRVFAFDGTYLYYPNSDRTGFYKLNLADNTDAASLGGSVNIETQNASDSNLQMMTPLVINSGLVLGSNYIINGNNVYPIRHVRGIGGADTYLAGQHWLWLVRQGAAVYGNAKQTYGTSSSHWSGQSNVLCNLFLSTIANLPEGKDKSTSQTMRVIYTTSEQT